MPAGNAYRPGDIVTTYDGKHIEIVNTDAEGRVVLADAIAYARRDLKAAAIVDLATLTGACGVALGDYAAGFWSSEDKLQKSSSRRGENSRRKHLAHADFRGPRKPDPQRCRADQELRRAPRRSLHRGRRSSRRLPRIRHGRIWTSPIPGIGRKTARIWRGARRASAFGRWSNSSRVGSDAEITSG
ncbi:MAG: hypothetical protein WDN28_17645 [Chthoniobacter sp.]